MENSFFILPTLELTAQNQSLILQVQDSRTVEALFKAQGEIIISISQSGCSSWTMMNDLFFHVHVKSSGMNFHCLRLTSYKHKPFVKGSLSLRVDFQTTIQIVLQPAKSQAKPVCTQMYRHTQTNIFSVYIVYRVHRILLMDKHQSNQNTISNVMCCRMSSINNMSTPAAPDLMPQRRPQDMPHGSVPKEMVLQNTPD